MLSSTKGKRAHIHTDLEEGDSGTFTELEYIVYKTTAVLHSEKKQDGKEHSGK